MSIAAATARASPLDPDWVLGALPCTKLGMKGGPRVLDLSKIIDLDGSSLAQLSVPECAELLAPLVASLGHLETSSFEAKTQALGAGEATVGTAAFRKAAGPRVMAAWGLEGLRGSLHSRGSKVFLPALREQGVGVPQPPTTQQEQVETPAVQQEVVEPREGLQETAAAPPAGAPVKRNQDSVIAQLRARLTVAEASCEVVKTVPATGPGAAAATAAPVATPTTAQRAATNEILQQGENKKFVDLVQSKDVPREVGDGDFRYLYGYSTLLPPAYSRLPSACFLLVRSSTCANKENTPPRHDTLQQ